MPRRTPTSDQRILVVADVHRVAAQGVVLQLLLAAAGPGQGAQGVDVAPHLQVEAGREVEGVDRGVPRGVQIAIDNFDAIGRRADGQVLAVDLLQPQPPFGMAGIDPARVAGHGGPGPGGQALHASRVEAALLDHAPIEILCFNRGPVDVLLGRLAPVPALDAAVRRGMYARQRIGGDEGHHAVPLTKAVVHDPDGDVVAAVGHLHRDLGGPPGFGGGSDRLTVEPHLETVDGGDVQRPGTGSFGGESVSGSESPLATGPDRRDDRRHRPWCRRRRPSSSMRGASWRNPCSGSRPPPP